MLGYRCSHAEKTLRPSQPHSCRHRETSLEAEVVDSFIFTTTQRTDVAPTGVRTLGSADYCKQQQKVRSQRHAPLDLVAGTNCLSASDVISLLSPYGLETSANPIWAGRLSLLSAGMVSRLRFSPLLSFGFVYQRFISLQNFTSILRELSSINRIKQSTMSIVNRKQSIHRCMLPLDLIGLGKWTYKWSLTVYGTRSPLSHFAHDLWLHLRDFVRHMNNLARHRSGRIRDIVRPFLRLGTPIWSRLEFLVRKCGRATRHGVPSGIAFVTSFLDANFLQTQEIVTDIITWNKSWVVELGGRREALKIKWTESE